MWDKLSRLILNNRITFLSIIAVATVFLSIKAFDVKLSFAGEKKILPVSDSAYAAYTRFKQRFGDDGNVMVIGVQSPNIFQKDFFNAWYRLSGAIKEVSGVKEVVSLSRIYDLVKDTAKRKFVVVPVVKGEVQTQAEMDSIHEVISRLRFYNGLVYQPESKATLMAISFDPKSNEIKTRTKQIETIVALADSFSKTQNVELHYSGLPYIRTVISAKLVKEFQFFITMALVICSIILLIFFRSLYAVIFPLLVVIIGVGWSMGLMALMGYKITILTGLVAPIVIVVGIPNSILILNKYYTEFRKYNEKQKALYSTIRYISISTLIANITTAIGFGVFYFTGSELLMEFGVIAALSILATWAISLITLPIIFSYLPAPQLRSTHLSEDRLLARMIRSLDNWITHHRPQVYGTAIVLSIISIIGMRQIEVNGYMIDDIPSKDPVYVNLKFFENNFNGIFPFEITIDTKKKGGVLSPRALNKISELEGMMAEYPEFSKPLSINSVLKFASQAFYNGNPDKFVVPSSMERNFILAYATGKGANTTGELLRSFVDSNRQVARISFQAADLGSRKMNGLVKEIQPRIDSIFAETGYDVQLTGSSNVFLKGNNYLIKNLRESLILAIILVGCIMFLLFRSWKMIIISLLPNLIPLAITAALMGFSDITLKPSTVLIFSIALGLASDQTIYFLTKYRQELMNKDWSISKTVSVALKETGISMTYTAIILFAGFSIFTFSTFGGTVLLGILVSFTVLMALIFNLTLLPALLLSLEKSIERKAMAEPLLQLYDEEEDIDINRLEIKD